MAIDNELFNLDLSQDFEDIEINVMDTSQPEEVSEKVQKEENTINEDNIADEGLEITPLDTENIQKDTPNNKEDLKEEKENEEQDKAEVIEEKEEEEDNDDEIESTDDIQNTLKTLAVFLSQKGVLSGLNEEDLNTEDVIGLIQSNIETTVAEQSAKMADEQVSKFVESLDPRLKNILQNNLEGVPLEDLLEADKTQMEYGNIKEEDLENNDDLAKKVILKDLIDKGFSKDEAQEMLDDMVTYENRAKKSLKAITARDKEKIEQEKIKAQQEKEKRAKVIEEQNKLFEKTLKETKELIPGIPITSKEKNKIKDLMYKPVAIDENGNSISYAQQIMAKDPMKFNMTMNWLLLVTDGFEDMSALGNKAKTSATKEFEEELKSNNSKFKKPVYKKKNKDLSDWKELEERFKAGKLKFKI